MQSTSPCPVCGCRELEPLTPPHPTQSVTSGTTFLKIPIEKGQCPSCGLGRPLRPLDMDRKVDFYRNEYGLYHRRPGTTSSELARYAAMAGWIAEELGEFRPQSVLDVGCSAGFLLEAFQGVFPGLARAGIEPSEVNSEAA